MGGGVGCGLAGSAGLREAPPREEFGYWSCWSCWSWPATVECLHTRGRGQHRASPAAQAKPHPDHRDHERVPKRAQMTPLGPSRIPTGRGLLKWQMANGKWQASQRNAEGRGRKVCHRRLPLSAPRCHDGSSTPASRARKFGNNRLDRRKTSACVMRPRMRP